MTRVRCLRARWPRCLWVLSQVLAAPSSHRASPSEEEPGALNKPGSHGTALSAPGHSPCWRSCSMPCAPTSQSFGAVWAVQVSAAPAGSSCAPVLKSFIIPLTVCVQFNFCWRTKLQYLPINCQDFALRIFVVDKCCLKYQNIQEDYISFIYMYF